ncbi:MAG: TOBE domain-containing protein, partial [Rhizobiales bacterium]|nr:TOBE domain-containing protein [Hyphomicrobiales bacterium]
VPLELLDQTRLELPPGAQPASLKAGIRPEHLQISRPDNAMLTARLRYVEPLGAETLIHPGLANDALLTVRQTGNSNIPDPGADCFVSFAPKNMCLFDEDGKRI